MTIKEDKWNWYLKDNEFKVYNSGGKDSDAYGMLQQKGFLKDICLKFVPTLKNKNIKILEIGCGDGSFLEYLKSIGYTDLCGVTLNQENVRRCKKRGIDCIYADMHELDIKSKSYDLIWCSETFEHSIAPFAVICEMNRILKSNGYAIILMPNPETWVSWTAHYSALYPEQMHNLFLKSGFKQVHYSIDIEKDFYKCNKKNNGMLRSKMVLTFIVQKEKEYTNVNRSENDPDAYLSMKYLKK